MRLASRGADGHETQDGAPHVQADEVGEAPIPEALAPVAKAEAHGIAVQAGDHRLQQSDRMHGVIESIADGQAPLAGTARDRGRQGQQGEGRQAQAQQKAAREPQCAADSAREREQAAADDRLRPDLYPQGRQT